MVERFELGIDESYIGTTRILPDARTYTRSGGFAEPEDALFRCSVRVQEEWVGEMIEEPGPEIIMSIMNINKANFRGSFRVNVSHQVLRFTTTCRPRTVRRPMHIHYGH